MKQDTVNTDKMNKEKQFELLHKTLVDIFKDYVDNVMKTLASLIIAIGWILTSVDAQEFIRKSDVRIYYTALAAIVSIGLVHTIISIGMQVRSQSTTVYLNELNFTDKKYYEHYHITRLHMFANLIVNIFMFCILFVMIFSLR